MTTGEKISYYIDQCDKTQKEIATIIDVSQSLLSQWKHDEVEAPMNKLHRLAICLNVNITNLIGDELLSGYSFKSNCIKQASSEYVTFPVVGEIAAGYDKLVLDDWDGETIPIHIDNLKGRPKEDFIVLEIKGNSMFPEFQNGDKVLIQRQNSLDYSGQVGAIIYDDDYATLKKIEYKEGEDWLKLVPINPNFETEKVEGERLEHCKVIGVPKLLIREYEQ